jgi:hypothetical protein
MFLLLVEGKSKAALSSVVCIQHFVIQELKMGSEWRGDTKGKGERSHHIAQFHTPTFHLEETKVGPNHAVNHLKLAVNCVSLVTLRNCILLHIVFMCFA